jgi:large subunit ribosomal protein L6
MSRIGKKIIEIPQNVSITLEENNILIKGKYGSLSKSFLKNAIINVQDNTILITRIDETKVSKAYHGLTRALIQNMISGVSEKFQKVLIAEGVGYKFQITGTNLILNMGFTNPINMMIPKDIEIKLESPTKIIISGIDKEKIGLLASQIRSVRPPEPYKGKGIMYEGEKIIRKAGKTGK